MIDFFESLYRHCNRGFLHIVPCPFDRDLHRIFFDISKGFGDIPKFIEQHSNETFPQWWLLDREYMFDMNLYKAPIHSEENVSTVVCLQVDVDIPFNPKILQLFKPSISVKTSTASHSDSDVDRWHFYYVLTKPMNPDVNYITLMARLYKLFTDNRYLYECTGYMLHARVPGTRNYWGQLARVVEKNDFEYSYDYFENLPTLDIEETLHYGNAYRRMFREPKMGIVG